MSDDPQAAVRDLAHALRLTREYVGPDVLPALPGWSWYDALGNHAPDVLAAILLDDEMIERHEPLVETAHVPEEPRRTLAETLPWAKPFQRRCVARMERQPGADYWGRCDLGVHGPDLDHALERGMEIVRWSTASRSEASW